MAGIDKAAMGWTVAIVAAGVGIALVGSSLDPGSVSPPVITTTMSDDKVATDVRTGDYGYEDKMMMKDEDKMMMKEHEYKDEDKMMMKDEDKMMMKEHEYKDEDKMMMKDEDKMMMKEHDDEMMKEHDSMDKDTMHDGPQKYTVSMPEGTGIPGCEETNMCYVPADITINVGDTVVWTNDEPQMAHTVTAGDLGADPNTVGYDYPDGFDSQFMMAGAAFEWTFDKTGTYPYYCQLHPWMVGTVQVN